MEIPKESPWNVTSLPWKTKVFIIFIITIGSLITLGLLGVFDTGTQVGREGWIGSTDKSGSPGESIYFIYSVGVEGSREDYNIEIRDFPCEWNYSINPSKLTVHPGEVRNMSIRIDIPEDTEIGESIQIQFLIHNWASLHGFSMGGGYGMETIHLTVVEETEDNDNEDNGGWGTGRWTSSSGLGIVYLIISLYLILFLQAIVFFLIPALMKSKKRSDQKRSKP